MSNFSCRKNNVKNYLFFRVEKISGKIVQNWCYQTDHPNNSNKKCLNKANKMANKKVNNCKN